MLDMAESRWTDAVLDPMTAVCDSPADELVTRLLASGEVRWPAQYGQPCPWTVRCIGDMSQSWPRSQR